jgi:hypothetical protein
MVFQADLATIDQFISPIFSSGRNEFLTSVANGQKNHRNY